MLDLLRDPAWVASAHAALRDSAGKGDAAEVARAEDAVRRDPSRLRFDPDGTAWVEVTRREACGGRFETPTLGALRRRVEARPRSTSAASVRLLVLLGTGPVTDVGALQALAPPWTLFQAASQFNCLEAPGPALVRVADYFSDPTQGPRASISAWPGTLVRHYAAPAPDGTRFVQTPGRQLDLLADAVPAAVARVEGGYLTSSGVEDPAGLVAALDANFERIRVGLHDGVDVRLGYDFRGAVQGSPRIAQLFTSTYAAGYSRGGALGHRLDEVCRRLLRAAYLGTLLGTAALGHRSAVLTAIGGGVFANPHPLIWEALLWALEQAAPLLPAPLDVVFNGRDFAVPRERLAADAARWGGSVVTLERPRA